MIVEQKLDLVGYYEVPWGSAWGSDGIEAMNQFEAFEKASGLCDLIPETNHNAGMIPDTFPQKIGIIDFDCMIATDTQREANTDNNEPQTWNRQASTAALAAGTAVLCGVAAVAKKITEINPIKILELGFAVGAITYYCSCPDNAAQGAGLAMAATSVVTIAAVKACSLVKNYLAQTFFYY